ncbi:MAG: ABC transporter substrate-binding protein, partial [Acidimicrobiales bacterium]
MATRVPSGKDLAEHPFSVTFHLDRRARWSDGMPLTSADVRFTWETILNPRWPVADRSAYRRLTDVVALGRHTVRLVFDAPYAPWRDLFSAGDFILPKHALEGKDLGAEWRSDVPLSAGPFLLEQVTPGLELAYVPNPRWWGPPPGLAGVRVLIVPDIETALQLLARGRVQVAAATSQLALERRMRRLPGVRSAARFGSAWWELGFNHARPSPGEVGFRRGVASALDRAGLVEALIREQGRPLQNLAPGRRPADAFGRYSYDPSKAMQVLRGPAAGAGKISLAVPAESEVASVTARAVQAGLRNVGLEIDIVGVEADRFYGVWRKEGRFDLALWERRGTPSMSLT